MSTAIQQAQAKKILYYKRIEDGTCVRCGIEQVPVGYVSCDTCRFKMRTRNKARLEKAKEKGLCRYCKKRPIVKGCYCEICGKKNRENSRELRRFYKELGVCPMCRKQKLLGDEKTCPECRAKYNYTERTRKYANTDRRRQLNRESYYRIRDMRRASGLCTQCGADIIDGNYKMCGRCRAKAREKNFAKNKDENGLTPTQARLSKGLCAKCDNPVKDGYKVCEVHYQALCKASHSRTEKQKNKWFKYF